MSEIFKRDPSVQVTGTADGTKENPLPIRSESEEARYKKRRTIVIDDEEDAFERQARKA